MARSRWKLKYFSRSVWKKIFILKIYSLFKKKVFYDRSSTIPSCFIDAPFKIHKGKTSNLFLVNRYCVGFKFGEFSFSRKPFHYPSKKKKK